MNEQILNKSEFSRTDTKAVKGVAVVLMLFHHIAGFPERFPLDFLGFQSLWEAFVENGYLQNFASSAKICISLFFFLGGYGHFIRRKSSSIHIISEIMSLYRRYWKVFIIFIPVGILFFANGEAELNVFCIRYVFNSKREMISTILSDFMGWTSILNREWWFFKSYICAMILGYLYCEFTEKNNQFWKDIFYVFVLDILIKGVFPSIAKTEEFSSLANNVYYKEFFMINSHSPAYFAGIVFAKYNGIGWIRKQIQQVSYPTIFSILGLCVLYWARSYIFYDSVDIVCCVFMTAMLTVCFNKCNGIKGVFVYLGKHSTNIWLIHSFYCYYFLEIANLVYLTRNVWVDLLILLLLSLVSSIGLEWFYSLLGRRFRKKYSF